jgi:CRISPR/Cas system-associated exonuclease Cas4 (RecB family)
MEILEVLKSALVQADNARARSGQVEIGASSIGGCRAQAWHIINQTPVTNYETEKLSAILGSAIHEALEKAIKTYDVFGDDFETEVELAGQEIKGHCDLYIPSQAMVVDYKTVTLKKIQRAWPPKNNIWQINIYAYLLNQAGKKCEKVCLIGIPRDGTMAQIIKWEADYSPEIAEEALAWLREVKALNTPPAPELPARYFCAPYCKYYDPSGSVGCVGK